MNETRIICDVDCREKLTAEILSIVKPSFIRS